MTAAGDLHQRGLAAAASGRLEEAVEYLEQAVAAAPAVRSMRTNLGLALARLGRHDQAAQTYRAALELEPGHAGTLAKLGRVLAHLGRLDEAVGSLEQAAALEPGNPDTANALGAVLAARPETAGAARRQFERAVQLDAGFGEAWRNLGLAEARAEHWTRAAEAYARAVALEPPTGQLFYQWGVSLGRAGRREEAQAAYERASAAEPNLAEAWNNLGHVQAALGQPEAARVSLERALAVRPGYVEARYNLGVTLQSLERLDEARRAYQLVLAAAGPHADAFNNLGGLCLLEAEPALAAKLYRQALAANPAHPEASWNLGLAQLSTGDWSAGWSNYETRPAPRHYGAPRWRHPEPLPGRCLLIWCEQGLGDGIQFLRYAAALRRLGASRLVLECHARLAPLFRLAEGIDEVIVRGGPVPVTDYQISMMSLPFELGAAGQTTAPPPPGPEYRLSPERRSHWRNWLDSLGEGLRAGLVWGGNSDNHQGLRRSIPLAALAPLAAIPNLRLVSLQHGPQRAELADHPALAGALADCEPIDLADTAALVSELDLVITVDTMMAHLAATLGRQTWVLLPFAADWRWMTARDDSPWYPAVRLFRQISPGGWQSVVERLGAALTGSEAATRD